MTIKTRITDTCTDKSLTYAARMIDDRLSSHTDRETLNRKLDQPFAS